MKTNPTIMKRFILLSVTLFVCIYMYAQKGYTEIAFPQGSSLPGGFFSSVAFDDSGHVWMGSGRKYPANGIGIGNGGLAKWDGTKLHTFLAPNWPLATNAVLSMAFANNFLWIGTSGGLQRYNRQGNSSANWKLYDSLKNEKVLCTKAIGDNLWIGSNSGLSLINMKTDSFTRFKSNLWGKPGSIVYNVTEGNNGELWLATTQGLVNKNGNVYTVYDTINSGLKTNTITTAYWKKSTSELWIGTDAGLYRLYNNTITFSNDISTCFAKVASSRETIFRIIEEKISGDLLIVVAAPSPSVANPPAFLRVKNGKVVKYFISSKINLSTELYVSSSQFNPLLLEYTNDNKLWLGVFGSNKYFIIDSLDMVANNAENLGKITGDDPQNLTINKVNALILNRGDMFWDMNSETRYEVPKNSCKTPLFASALWMGGVDAGNNLHMAAMTYRYNGVDFFTGPLDTITSIGNDNAPEYRKIWKINRWDIEEFKKKYADGSLANGSYTPPANFLSWPAHGKNNYSYNMAPFVDVDANGKYEPMKGDYPAIKGEQALYWIFNDNSGIHGETNALPMGVEIHAMAYAYNCDTIMPSSPNEALNYTTFYEYKIINRSSNAYNNTYYGIWTDVDLGFFGDDKVGSNIPGNFAYVYNGDNDDEGILGYGKNPPMLSVVMLSDTMTNFMCYANNFSHSGSPVSSQDYYNYLNSQWKDNSSLTFGGNGYNTGTPVKHIYSGIPYTTGEWTDSISGDRRFLQSAGPYNLAPGGVKTLSYAIVYSHEPNQPNGLTTSWAKNLRDVNAVKNWYGSQNFPTCLTNPVGVGIGKQSIDKAEIKVVPNPFSGYTSIWFSLPNDEKISVDVYNMLGQKVYSSPVQALPAGNNSIELPLTSQPAGAYVYKLTIGTTTYSGRIINMER